MSKIKSPLRYPGGKSRVVDRILSQFPSGIREYREPFLGGGSVLLAAKEKLGDDVSYLGSDLNYDLWCFWQMCQDFPELLAEEICNQKRAHENGRSLFLDIKDANPNKYLETAVRFFILNRITFSGVVDSGGYSQQAYDHRFTQSSIDRILSVSPALQGVKLTYGDYEPLLTEPGDGAFIFLDPPYFSATKSKLYGRNGKLHTEFDHDRLAQALRQCPHRWLITYDDSPEIRSLYAWATIESWELGYGMRSIAKGGRSRVGREVFIRNY